MNLKIDDNNMPLIREYMPRSEVVDAEEAAYSLADVVSTLLSDCGIDAAC